MSDYASGLLSSSTLVVSAVLTDVVAVEMVVVSFDTEVLDTTVTFFSVGGSLVAQKNPPVQNPRKLKPSPLQQHNQLTKHVVITPNNIQKVINTIPSSDN